MRLCAGWTLDRLTLVLLAAFLLLRVTGAAEVKEPTDVFGAERILDRFDVWTQSVRAGIEQGILKWMKVRMAYPFEITQRGSLEYANHIAQIGLRFKF